MAGDSSTLTVSRSRVDEMGSEELMIENPVSLTVLLDLLTSNFANHVPLFQLVPLTIYP